MNMRNEDIKELVVEIPEGHKHLRTSMLLEDGTKMTFQEATIANLVRAYISVKTHPTLTKVIFRGSRTEGRKEGYAEWQLME